MAAQSDKPQRAAMRESDWDQLFLNFIRKRGLRDVENVFQRYVRAPQQQEPEDSMSVQQAVDLHTGLLEDIANFAADNDAGVYTDMYEQFAGWVDNSLDMYRPELRQLLHPVFLHCYLQLVERDAAAPAAALMAKYRSRVLSGHGGQPRRAVASDLQQLASITSRHHLRSSPFAAGLQAGKTAVPLSPYAHDLLMRFLHNGGARTLPLLSVVNGHIDLQVLEGLPRGAAAAVTAAEEEGDDWGVDEAGPDAGPAPADAATAMLINRTEVKLGLLQGNVEDLYREQQEKQRAEAAAAAGPAGDGAGPSGQAAGGAAEGAEPQTKKAKKAAEKAAAAAKAAEAASQKGGPKGERIEHPAFLPHLPDDVVSTALQDIGARAPVSAAVPPSCAFFTFVNAKQTLNCCTFNRDGSKIVAGFTDSSVRLYDMPTISAYHAQLRRSRPARPATANGHADPAAAAAAAAAPDPDDVDTEPPGTSYLYGHTAAVHGVDLSPDQRLVLSGSSDGTIRLWGAEFASCLVSYTGHMFPVWDVAFCPMGQWFASAGADRVARLWVTDRTAPLRLLVGHGADVDVVRWHPNCCLVATGSCDRTVRLWDVREGKAVRYISGGLYGAPTALALAPSGTHLAVGTDDGLVAVWDLGSARRIAASPPAASHAGPVWSLAYSQGDGAVLASGGADETVRLWRNDLAEANAGSAEGAAAGGSGAAGAAGAGAGAGAAGGRGGPAAAAAGGAGGGVYGPIGTYRTKSSPVVSLSYSSRNLLLAAGPFHRRGPITG
ncbi:hypothetical protein HYH03_003098 [Edaphochlamys debaryana]|uniref:TFIID subunit TAF5 NTD2 domain-containing protein n=1 Tax=Edaphochlamys debaryana TaxID=47281 RepID=A0A835YCA0_9CHLO|nr:hypothetical protein HYH03_003098 [Edaphochlamys debaryana]|eukprot:KAG2498907.1 hypothetical protein HYH03_003098 [Edaphochlamys debaryana]